MPRYKSFVDSPSLRVSRAVAACSRCRQAKIKCNGNLPACDACKKQGREEECSTSNDQFAKGKERSFVASLEARIEKLQKRLEFANARKASVATKCDVIDAAVVPDRKDSLALIRGAVRGSAARRKEAQDIDRLVSDFGFFFTTANTRDFESSTTTMTFARLILAASAMAPMPTVESVALPPRTLVLDMVYHYIDNVLVLYPAFNDVTVLSTVETLYYENGRNATASEFWLVYMVLAIANLCRSTSNGDEFYVTGVNWASRALVHADQILVPGHISQIQALILLVQFSMLDPAHFDCWLLLGFATRSVVDIGLHQDPTYVHGVEPLVVDTRRRIFHTVYALDRSISMVHHRPFSFTDDATSVAFPTMNQSTVTTLALTTPRNIDMALVLFQVRRLQSKWYQELFMASREPLELSSPYVWSMLGELQDWFENLPRNLSVKIHKVFVLEYLYSTVYCLAPSRRSSVNTEMAKTLIFERGTEFISTMYEVVKNSSLRSAFLTYYDVLKVLFVSRQVTAILDDSEDNQDILFNPNRPHMAPPVAEGTRLPLVANHGKLGNIEKAIAFIGQTAEIFEAYGKRWEDSKNIQVTFKTLGKSLLPQLHRLKLGMANHNAKDPKRYAGTGVEMMHKRSLPTPSSRPILQQSNLQHEHSY